MHTTSSEQFSQNSTVRGQKALILGANGRFGRASASIFSEAGWKVLQQTRASSAVNRSLGNDLAIDLTDHDALAAAAGDCDVIVNALNPLYPHWRNELPKITASVIRLAKATGTTILLPGNVYNFGEAMPHILSAETSHDARTKKGLLRIEMEQAYRDAAQDGVQTIILRVGDFLEREQTGNWFDTHLTKNIAKGTLLYPGRTDIAHAWGYLPDTARALVGLAERRHTLPKFIDVPFEGNTLTAEQLRRAAEIAMGHPVRLKPFPWWLLRLASPFMPVVRELKELRYLWDTPHALDGSELQDILPDFQPTPLGEIMRDILHDRMRQ